MAGLSAGAALAEDRRVVVLEAEEAIGVHSSGRSATMLHFALGDALVRALTLASRDFFDSPSAGFSDVPLARRVPVLIHAREDEVEALRALDQAIAPFAQLEWLDAGAISQMCPALKIGPGGAEAGIADRHGLRLDPHALLQGFARQVRRAGGELVTGARITAIRRGGAAWTVETERGESYSAPILVNAAGAWADAIARLADVSPIGLRPLRRTIITFDGPAGTDVSGWPFAKTVGDELYFAPESGRLFASPMDEVETDPCDAQPEELEVALAAYRMEERTHLRVERIVHRWAGLRSFAPDRRPVVGYAPDEPGFFWLAGQGGFGLQTSPVLAQIAASLILQTAWPIEQVSPAELSPARFLG